MAGYGVRVDLSQLFSANAGIVEALYPLVAQAVRAVAEEGAFRWKQGIQHARLWEGEKAPYIESISWKMVGPMEAEISTDYRYAGEIETGRPPKDLKRALLTSLKTRIAENGKNKGKRYLIIPMRHNTPGQTAHAAAMPKNIYKQAKGLSASRLLAPGTVNPPMRLSGAGFLVAQHSYKWGGRLPAGLAPKLKPTHKTDPYAGMVRFDTSTGKSKSSSYLTFRVMMEGSNGWIVPARPGLYIAKQAAEQMQPLLEDAVGKALSLTSAL